MNELHIEYEQDQEGSNRAEHQVADGLIDEPVDVVVVERGLLTVHLRVLTDRVLPPAHHHRALEAQGDVVEHRAQTHYSHGPLGPTDDPEVRVEGLTDSHVAVDGKDDHRPDGDSLGDGGDRPDVRVHPRVDVDEPAWRPLDGLVDGFDWLDEQTGDKVESVHHSQCTQKPVGGVRMTILRYIKQYNLRVQYNYSHVSLQTSNMLDALSCTCNMLYRPVWPV